MGPWFAEGIAKAQEQGSPGRKIYRERMRPQSTDDLGARVALLQSPILRDRASSIHHQNSQHQKHQKCNLCAREKMLPMYRNTHGGIELTFQIFFRT